MNQFSIGEVFADRPSLRALGCRTSYFIYFLGGGGRVPDARAWGKPEGVTAIFVDVAVHLF